MSSPLSCRPSGSGKRTFPSCRPFHPEIRQADEQGGEGLSRRRCSGSCCMTGPGNVRELRNTIEYAMAMTRMMSSGEDGSFGQGGPVRRAAQTPQGVEGCLRKGKPHQYSEGHEGECEQRRRTGGKYRADFYNLLKKYELNPGDSEGAGPAEIKAPVLPQRSQRSQRNADLEIKVE